jgi:hypothetical protein
MRWTPSMPFVLVALALACSDSSGPSGDSPTIYSLGPNATLVGADAFPLSVYGGNFDSSAVVTWDGANRPTHFVSATELTADLAQADLSVVDTVIVRVTQKGRQSNGAAFEVSTTNVGMYVTHFEPGSTEVGPDTTIQVTFSQDLDLQSVTDSNLTVLAGSVALPRTLSYDSATRTLAVSLSAPLDTSYAIHLTPQIRSRSLGAMNATISGTYTTPGARFILIGPGGYLPSVSLAAGGHPAVLYGGPLSLQLGSCAGTCDLAASWSTALIATYPGYADFYSSMARAASGALHLGYATDRHIAYRPAGGAEVLLDSAITIAYNAIAVGPSNRVHLLYYGDGDLRHATCASSCTTPAGWSIETVDASGDAGAFVTAAVDPSGGVHVAYLENNAFDLRYATCPGPCSGGGWTVTPIDTAGNVGIGVSIQVDSASGVHLVYGDQTNATLKFAECAANCGNLLNWTSGPIAALGTPPSGFYEPSLSLIPGGGMAVGFTGAGAVRLARCATGCTTAGNWQTQRISRRQTGDRIALVVDAAGEVHLAWAAFTGVMYSQF